MLTGLLARGVIGVEATKRDTNPYLYRLDQVGILQHTVAKEIGTEVDWLSLSPAALDFCFPIPRPAEPPSPLPSSPVPSIPQGGDVIVTIDLG